MRPHAGRRDYLFGYPKADMPSCWRHAACAPNAIVAAAAKLRRTSVDFIEIFGRGLFERFLLKHLCQTLRPDIRLLL